ncbi:MAG TPA: alcohol dehydrogenase catalytic domain-containing protein [Candidatus Limivivens intestinipullorum]|uniref:Alcohol dehydrogenase catalytic domain-containing protein n=1 Tax=Candidatus Limivivens intestinipullorum TaxID=2840858 RepID=A0A9D1ER53_9FIRM|nr:alcohol dehydrogenase catalytic domain-containing protein [Candidatus Limivivens intestinipullorum]
MRRARLTEVGKIEVETAAPVPEISSGQALVQVKAVGICGTDLHIFKEGRSDVALPRVMGHELSGVVTKIGDGVKNVKPGDRVVMDPVIACGKCRTCRKGHPNVCESVKCFGVQMDGGFQDYIGVDAKLLYPFPETLSFEEAALAEPFSVASNVLARTRVFREDRIVIIGAGTIGLCILQAAKGIGAEVLISDIENKKLERAAAFGADRVVNTREESLEAAAEAFFPGGADVIIDAVGSAALTQSAVDLAAPCARIAVLAFDGKNMEIPPVRITKKELELIGSRMNCGRFPEVLEWMKTRAIRPEQMITAVYPVEEIQRAFEDLASGRGDAVKTIIRF